MLLVSGQLATVQSTAEQQWFEATRDAYIKQTKFTETTDLRDLDRLLVLELMVFRWTQHLAAGVDYYGDATNDEQLRKNIREYSDQINKIKDSMGLNKKSRDEAASEGNFSLWLSDLKARAKVFGVHRERQLTKALALFNELSSIIGMFDRSDDEERRKIGFESSEDVLDWIRKVALPEYAQIDQYFQDHEQRYWIREM